MSVLDTIQARREEIHAIAKKHNAEKLWVFGSVARREETPASDIDILVKFTRPIGLFEYGHLQDELSSILGRNVDVVQNTVLFREPRFAAHVCPEAIQI